MYRALVHHGASPQSKGKAVIIRNNFIYLDLISAKIICGAKRFPREEMIIH